MTASSGEVRNPRSDKEQTERIALTAVPNYRYQNRLRLCHILKTNDQLDFHPQYYACFSTVFAMAMTILPLIGDSINTVFVNSAL